MRTLRVRTEEKTKTAVVLSTYGIFFLGTPHQGGQVVEMGKVLARIGSLVTFTGLNIIRHLAQHSEWLWQQYGQYAEIANEFDTKFFYGTYKMPIPVYGQVLASQQSGYYRGEGRRIDGALRWCQSILWLFAGFLMLRKYH